jgi:HSP20 family protein
MLVTMNPLATRLATRQLRARSLAPAIRAYKADPSSEQHPHAGKKLIKQKQDDAAVEKAPAASGHGGLPARPPAWAPSSLMMPRAMMMDPFFPPSAVSMLRAMDNMMEPFFSRVFDDDFFGGRRMGQHEEASPPTALLPLDVHEEDSRYVLKADLPGVDKNDVSVEVSPDGKMLTVAGSRSEERREGGGNEEGGAASSAPAAARPLRVERRWSSWSRSVALSPDVDVEAIKASLKDGILSVDLPKKPAQEEEEAAAAPKRVAVE